MGTNYYLHKKSDACPTCGHREGPRHIGKSSAGWCFLLAVYPNDGILDLADWVARWSAPEVLIRDEYGQDVTPAQMLAEVTERHGSPRYWSPSDYERNHAAPGPNGLVRHRFDDYTTHGAGTWDCTTLAFS